MIRPRKRDKEDVEHLYGMQPTPIRIYLAQIRADNGRATTKDESILREHIADKTAEIRKRRLALGIEGLTRQRTVADSRRMFLQAISFSEQTDGDGDAWWSSAFK